LQWAPGWSDPAGRFHILKADRTNTPGGIWMCDIGVLTRSPIFCNRFIVKLLKKTSKDSP
jgi:hypothetical protein